MAINFPDSPAENDSFTSGGKKWIYNGTVWSLITANSYTIPTGEVTTAKILDANVTAAKLASGAAVANIGYTPANTASPTFTGTVVLPATTSIGTVSNTEIGYVDGVTSAIQTQLDSKLTATTAVTSNRNVVINGGFDVWQRGTSTAGNNVFLADRWGVNWPTGITISQQTDVPSVQYLYSHKQIATATNSYSQFGQQIEFQNCKQFQNQVTTISFWAKAINSNAGSTALTVRTRTIAGVDGSCRFAGTAVDTSVTLTTSWAKYTVARTMPATFGSASIELSLGSHLSGDGFFVTGIQWELGAVATPFEFEDYGTTLAKCQRYCLVIGKENNNYGPTGFVGNMRGTTTALIQRSLPQNMRGAPTVTIDSAANFNIDDGTTLGFVPSSFALDRYSANALMMYANVTGGTTGRAVIVYGNSVGNGIITVSSEL